MNLIVETDLGHDPDDFFALCYLHAAGVNIKAILITPGDPDQIAIAKLFCREVGLNIPIGVSDLERKELSSGSIHHALLKRYGHSLHTRADCSGEEAIATAGEFDQFFVIGPATHTAEYLAKGNGAGKALTMQGGFLPYSHYTPTQRLTKFEGIKSIRTFNLLGDTDASQVIIDTTLTHKQFVGKNVCHTIEFGKPEFEKFSPPKCRASELFHEAANSYFAKNRSKKFHDPTAAVCMLHPEIGTWIRGNPEWIDGGYTTRIHPEGAHILADIDREELWRHLNDLY